LWKAAWTFVILLRGSNSVALSQKGNGGPMSKHKPYIRWRKSNGAFIGVAIFLLAMQLPASEYFVGASVSTLDCGKFEGGVKPGDTLTLAAGERGPIRIIGCQGTAEKPIWVRNDPKGNKPTTILRRSASSGGFIFECLDCVHLVIDGTGKWQGAAEASYCGAPAGKDGCGIRITAGVSGDSPSTYLALRGKSTKVTVRGVEVDGRWSELGTQGIGIQQNDQSVTMAKYPGFWREDFIYENNYVHDVHGEGLYIGPYWRESDPWVPQRNITIRYNLVEDTGRENIQMKAAIDGDNQIHHNVVRRSGLRAEEGQMGAGLSAVEGGQVKIHHNWIEQSGMQGIQHFNHMIPKSEGPFTSEIYNNVIYNSGAISGDARGYGITVNFASGSAEIVPTVYNNTVVRTGDSGINFGSGVTGGVARNNIVADAGTSALRVGDNISSHNLIGSSSSIGFANAALLDFNLTDRSAARDAASLAIYALTDFNGVRRPQGAAPDQGAFEYTLQAAPVPPQVTGVQ
jgi:hypothetical protein